MNKFLPFCALGMLLLSLSACSQKNEANADANATVAAPADAASPNPVPPPANPAGVAAVNSLPAVTKAMESRQYEAAVQTLVQMKPATAQMTDAQRLQYQQAVRDTTTALLGVKDRDPAAKAAYEKLSRAATGR